MVYCPLSGQENPVGKRMRLGMSGKHSWHKRHAIQLVAQLPEKTEDALLVLDHARDLVMRFLAEPATAPLVSADVKSFPASANSR